MHLARVEKRAFPSGPVVQHQAAQVHAGQKALGQGGRCRVKQPAGTCGRQRRAAARPGGGEGLQRCGVARSFAAAVPTLQQARPHAPRLARLIVGRHIGLFEHRTAHGAHRAPTQQRVNHQVPRHHTPYRRREQVDALAAANRVSQQARCPAHEQRPNPPLRPPHAPVEPRGDRRLAWRQALHGMVRTLGNEVVCGRLRAGRLQRRAAGPGAVLRRPQRVVAGVSFNGSQQDNLARGGFVHGPGISR